PLSVLIIEQEPFATITFHINEAVTFAGPDQAASLVMSGAYHTSVDFRLLHILTKDRPDLIYLFTERLLILNRDFRLIIHHESITMASTAGTSASEKSRRITRATSSSLTDGAGCVMILAGLTCSRLLASFPC